MRRWFALLMLAAPLVVPAAYAQPGGPALVTSDGPARVTMTVYRDADRGDEPIDRDWPGGYALITETRTIKIPAGLSVIRFEGVSEGMYPESAIVTGLPKGVKEKNRDARLLSPAGLIDAYLKRQVTLTRTDRATGKSRKQNAMITAGPTGGVILETEEGFEALRCTGLPERMSYARVPQDLAAKPTLSVLTQSARAVTATVTLSYLAAGFDWQANYVAHAGDIRPDRKIGMNILAWLTVANGGNQGFDNADLQVVAGRLNKEDNTPPPQGPDPSLHLECWPMQRSHQVPFRQPYGDFTKELKSDFADETIVVTASRLEVAPAAFLRTAPPPPPPLPPAVVAVQEDLGDLKLYRVPERVDVKAKGQKQVAMIVKPKAEFELIYKNDLAGYYGARGFHPLFATLRSRNETDKGLGVPLPAGQGAVFEQVWDQNLLAGEITVADRAVGEKIEWRLPRSNQVQLSSELVTNNAVRVERRLTLSNAHNYDVAAEIKLPESITTLPENARRVDGENIWFVKVPANDRVSAIYRIDQ